MKISTSFFLLCLTALFAWPVRADWRQFRGPHAAGVSLENIAAPATLGAENLLWKIALPGRGLSSPIVVNDRVFLTACSGPKQDQLHIICLNAADGSKKWERIFQATGRTMCHQKTCVAAPTPCSDGSRIYALFSTNDVFCLDLDGNLIWLRGLTHDYPNASNSLGMASSPLIVGTTLVAQIENDTDSFTVGLDASTGINIWKLERPRIANWTSPISWELDGMVMVGLMSNDGLAAVDPATGSVLWKAGTGGPTITSAVAAGDVLYAPHNGLMAYDLKTTGKPPEQLWESAQLASATASPLVVGENVYTLNGAGVLAQANAKSGERGWKLRMAGPFSGSPVASGIHLYIASEKGLLQVVDTTVPEGKVESEFDLAEVILCTPAISAGQVYVRSDGHIWKFGAK